MEQGQQRRWRWRKVSRHGGGGGRSAEKVGWRKIRMEARYRWSKANREGGGGRRPTEKVEVEEGQQRRWR